MTFVVSAGARARLCSRPSSRRRRRRPVRLRLRVEHRRDFVVEGIERGSLNSGTTTEITVRRVSASAAVVFSRAERAQAEERAARVTVVGTYQLACIRIVNASASFTGTSRSPSEATPTHWHVPT